MSTTIVDESKLMARLSAIAPEVVAGRIAQLVGLIVQAEGLEASIGELCFIDRDGGGDPILAEVVGFTKGRVLLMPYHDIGGVKPGDRVRPSGGSLRVPVGEVLLGKVLDGVGRPLDGSSLPPMMLRPTVCLSPRPLDRKPIGAVLTTGVKAIDGCLTCGRGQRMGIFSGSGVGKSTLLGMICRNAQADVSVVALIGERGREVGEFINGVLGGEGMAKSVVVAVTSDESPLMRIKGAETAMTIAEYFRDKGKDVVFVMDSVTRYAMAVREVALSAGEVPTSRGYTPSVFARLPVLLERAGTSRHGSITAFFSVLVEGDEIKNDPITDAIRAILDGHIVLSRKMANANIFPAVDLLASISRLAPNLLLPEQRKRMTRIIDLLAAYSDAEDMINIGAYTRGSNPRVDEAIAKIEGIRSFIRQGAGESFSFDQTQTLLREIVGE